MDDDLSVPMVRGKVSIEDGETRRGAYAEFAMTRAEFQQTTNAQLVERFIKPAGYAAAQSTRRHLQEG